MSFFNIGLQERLSLLGRDHYLAKIQKPVDWVPIEKLLHNHLPKSRLGRDGYNPLKMLKAILLGQWHSLTYPALEEALCVRLDFIAFTQLEVGDPLPDETTLCRFRNRLIHASIHEQIFFLINAQLLKKGSIIQQSEGAVVGATLISSSCHPRKQIDYDKNKQEVKYSADEDARWVVKGSHKHFGYKGFVRTNRKFIKKH